MIMLINMTVVFAVLFGLSWVVRLIQYIDPARKKKDQLVCEIPKNAEEHVIKSDFGEKLDETAVILAAAVAAYGYSSEQIVSICRTDGNSIWR